MLKFKKKELIQRLGMSEELAKKVMDAQKKFPTLLATENEKGFQIDGRTIWTELGEPQGEFNKWIKRKVIDKNYKENIDYIKVDNSVEVGNLQRPQTDYTLKLNCAKKVAMRENTDNGDIVCDYFIILEEAIKNMKQWYIIRNPQKQSYKEMCATLEKQYMETHEGNKPDFHIYTNNADMINLCMFGKKSKAMKQILDVDYDDLLRDSLTAEANQSIHQIQLLNENLVLSNVDFQQENKL